MRTHFGLLFLAFVVSGCTAGRAVTRGDYTAARLAAGTSDSGDSSQSDSGNSSQSDSSKNSSGNSSGATQSGADGTVQSEQSQHPTTQQSQQGTSKPSADSSRTSGQTSKSSTDSSNESSANSSKGSSNTESQTNVGPVFSTAGLSTTIGAIAALIWLRAQPKEDVAKAAEAWLRANEHQLEEDLALGAGPSIRDLAALAQIRRDHLVRFGRVLRAHRAELLALAESARLTPDRATATLRQVGEWAAQDPVLAEDAERAMQVAEAR